MHRRTLSAACAAAAAVVIVSTWSFADQLEDTLYIPLDHPAIRYDQQPTDPVARLAGRLAAGQTKLDFAPNGWGYLPSLLKQLDVPVDSQVLVFSKTSIQAAHISPRTPRAIYFNDDVAVGYVQNGEALELSALDPKLGVNFYTLDTEKSDRLSFSRRQDCLRCHQGPITFGVPGIFISSIQPSSVARESHGSAFVTDDRIPLDQRWGGWYVTGTHGAQKHLGNNVGLVDPLAPGPPGGPSTQNVTSLAGLFDTSKYLAPTSDLVALMTLEHQTRMTNLITRIGWDARIAAHDGRTDAATREKLDSEIGQMVAYMLFADEAPLQAPVAGVSTFTTTFSQRGPRDRQGRSLRDFDLKTHLFRYPLSYMIYSQSFDSMPQSVRDRVYQRLWDVLTGKDQSKTFARLSAADRGAILEILRDTKPGLPDYWKGTAKP